MAIEIKVPSLGESVTEVEIGAWLKREGDAVNKDENIVTLESEKATVDLPAPAAGTLAKIVKRKGEKATVGDVIALFEPGDGPPAKAEPKPEAKPEKSAPAPAPVAASAPPAPARPPERKKPEAVAPLPPPPPPPMPTPATGMADRQEEIVPMTLLRRTVAQRLVEASQTMAMLTTFNEIDLSAVIALRKQYQETFTEKVRRQARVHVVLRQGGRRGLEGDPAGQRLHPRQRHCLSSLL